MAEIVSIKGSETPEGPVTTSQDGKVMTITLSNPPANSLSLKVIAELHKALLDARDNRSVNVIVIAAANSRIFSAGHDLKEIKKHHKEDEDRGNRFLEELFSSCSEMMKLIPRLPKTVIAKVDGIATAAGCQLVAACDMAFCTEEAHFATPGVNIGGFCATPMVALSRNISRKHAIEMLLTGEMIDAQTALRFGLVNKVVPRDYLDQVTYKYAHLVASKSPIAIAKGKLAFYQQAEMRLSEAYDYANKTMVDSFTTRDCEEGLAAFFEKRDPEWTGE